MGEAVLIYGKSGNGKTRSLVNFSEDEIFFVNVIGKRPPFAKNFKYTLKTDSMATIIDQLKKMPTNTAVIDDAGYIMTNQFMRNHRSGNQFDLYNNIADGFWTLINTIKELPDNKIVYIIMHEDSNDYGEVKLRTIGKLLNDKVCIEGMATIVLRAIKKDAGYYFQTKTNGNDISKSPEGMLEDCEPNDLKAIDTKIRKYWKI